MNIKQLKYANALAKEESFSLAAKACFVSQPTLSNSIHALEQEFGQPMFNRTTRKVELSTFGRDIFPFIHTLLNAEISLIEQIDIMNKSEDNIIRIGISPLVNSNIIMPVIEAYKCTQKHSKIIINEVNLDQLNQQLTGEILDVIFIPRVPDIFLENEYDNLFLYKESLHIIKKDLDPFYIEINLKDIEEETFLMVPHSCGLSVITRNLLEITGKSIKEYEGLALSYQILAEWASCGLGVAILPKSKIPTSIKHSALLLHSDNSIDLSFDVKWKKSNEKTRPLIEFIKSTLKI